MLDGAVFRHGAIAGLLAGAVLIALFFAFDMASGEQFATPTFLSGAMLGDVMPEPSHLRLGLFTVAHFAVFTALGIAAELFFTLSGLPRHPVIGGAYGLFACSLVLYSALMVTGTDLMAAPAWRAMLLGNVVAGVVIVSYLRWANDKGDVTDA